MEHPDIYNTMRLGYPHHRYLDYEKLHARHCSVCGNGMDEGYMTEISDDYFCSSKCLEKAIPQDEQKEMFDEGILFWTDWHCESSTREK